MRNANLAHSQGRWDDCKKFCEAILDVLPVNVPALVLCGVALSKAGDTRRSVGLFERAIAADHTCGPAYLWLSMAFQELGEKAAALLQAQQAVALNPGDPLTLHQYGRCLLDFEQYDAALKTLQRTVEMAPNAAMAHHSLGLAFQSLNRNSEAIIAFRRSVKLEPSSLASLVALRNIFFEEGNSRAAAEAAREVLKLQPDSADANLWLALTLMEVNQATEADLYVHRSLELAPDSAPALSLLGTACQVRGRLEEANSHFRRSIELLPQQGSAYWFLAANRRLTETDRPIVRQMQAVLGNEGLSLADQSQVNYAIGKALEDLGEFQGSMGYRDEANRISYQIKFGNKTFDPKSLDSYDQLTRTITSDCVKHQRISGPTSELPIFVVGMIRSGTTLVEQILSCHPHVGAAGEQPFWLENGNAALAGGGTRVDMPMLVKLAAKYHRMLEGMAPGKMRVVDKMPMNYQAMGLIHLAFPKAKIIHVRRHPIDTCLSIYTTPNRVKLPWAHDKGNIAFAYKKYLQLMNHWRAVLPSDTLLEVRYEDIVGDQEQTIRSLIDFCGLEWDEACLHPELNERTVVTPSVWQVRQPVYKTSVERWRKFEPWLGPLAKLNES